MALASTFLKQLLIHLLGPVLGALPACLPAHMLDAVRNAAYQLAHAAAPVAVSALWQGAVVAAGLALCLRFAPRVGAAHRFVAWAAGFAALVALPFVPAAGQLFSRLLAPAMGSSFGANSLPSPAAEPWLAHPLLAISDRWSFVIAALWILLALARGIDLAIHTARLRRLWKTAKPIPAFGGVPRVDGKNENAPRFELCTTRELDRPSVIGFFRPRILIPEWLLERLTERELDQVVLHEAEHLRRCDDWTNLLQKLCLVIFPLNPALAFVERRLCSEREMACDEGVVRRTQAPRAYAACLAGLAERHLEHRAEALSLGAFERRPELARRVHSILMKRSAMHPAASLALVGAVGCALAVGAVALARCPQLVAFVPAETKAAQVAQVIPAEFRDKAITPAASEFHAVDTMAVMPETTERRGTHCRAAVHEAASHRWESNYRQTVLSAPAEAAEPVSIAAIARGGAAVPQELIVLTAFEQVRTDGDVLGDKVVSDYGTGTIARPVDGGAGRMTMTRLIFRIYAPTAGARESDGPTTAGVPAGSAATATQNQPAAIPTSVTKMDAPTQKANQASGQAAANLVGQMKPDVNSSGSQPHAVSLGNGWFVIQL